MATCCCGSVSLFRRSTAKRELQGLDAQGGKASGQKRKERHEKELVARHEKEKPLLDRPLEKEEDAYAMFVEYMADGACTKSKDAGLQGKVQSFFGDLHLSTTGGLSECQDMFKPGRYAGLIIFVGQLILNTFNIIRGDLMCINLLRVVPRSEWLIHEVWLDEMIPGAYITPDRLFAIFELVGLAIYFLNILYLVVKINRSSGAKLCYRRWTASADLCLRLLPSMQTFSSMRMLQYIVPAVFTPKMKTLLLELKGLDQSKWLRKSTALPMFVLTHMVFFFFGFEAFLVKFRQVNRFLSDTDHQAWAVLQLAMFMNQMLGIVQLKIYTQNRLFKFIFGGVDNHVDVDEQYRQDVWKATFVQRVWEASGRRIFPFLSVLLTFNDEDFQQMVLD